MGFSTTSFRRHPFLFSTKQHQHCWFDDSWTKHKNSEGHKKGFILLRELQNKINKELGQNRLIHLSMGMTGDYEIGVEEGSTMIRVGTGLFGQRVF